MSRRTIQAAIDALGAKTQPNSISPTDVANLHSQELLEMVLKEDVDTSLSANSTNPVQNKAITARIAQMLGDILMNASGTTEFANLNLLALSRRIAALEAAGGGDKEIIEVADYAALEALTDPQQEVIYITADDNKLYIYNGEAFVEVTDSVSTADDTIVVRNLNYLLPNPPSDPTLDADTYAAINAVLSAAKNKTYTVIHSYVVVSGSSLTRHTDLYMLFVGQTQTVRILSNRDGYSIATLDADDWTWVNKRYVFQQQIDELMPLIYAGL